MTIDPHLNQALRQATPRLEKFLHTARKPLVVILGPTASGKTAFSIALSHLLELSLQETARTGQQESTSKKVEIVNSDSRQLYKHLTIGTAKITPQAMEGVPHHLLDVLDPREEITAATYKTLATAAIDDILARKNLPMLVGGSMLYISAVIDDLQFPTASDPVLRKTLEEEYERDGGVTVHKKLAALDPESAAGIPVQNKPYVIRALEIIQATGRKLSTAQGRGECPYDVLILGISRSREELLRRIDQRTGQLLCGGWIEEVAGMQKMGYGPRDPGMKSHGYREILARLEAGSAPSSLHTDATLAAEINKKTRQYAKRQMTWWRYDPRIHWLDYAA